MAKGSACAGRSGMCDRGTAAAALAWRERYTAMVTSACWSTAAVMVEHCPRQVQHECPSCSGSAVCATGALADGSVLAVWAACS